MFNRFHIGRIRCPGINLVRYRPAYFRMLLVAGLSLAGVRCPAQADTEQMDTPADSLAWFNARIVDNRSGRPVQFAHIVNTHRGFASISDTLGYFYIRAARGHELQISAIGYSLRRQTVSDSILAMPALPEIPLIPHVYPIDAVTVNPLGNYDQFRRNFIEFKPPEPRYSVPDFFLNDISMGLDTIRSMSPRPIASPVTFFYNLWSREGKEMRKMAEILEEEEFMREIRNRYSPEIVSQITGYVGSTLYEFLEFCKFNRQFLRTANDYDIAEAVLEKQRMFEELRNR